MNTDKIYAESIVNEYSVKETSKVVALKKLDRKAKMPSMIFGLTFGIISALIFGVGMYHVLEVVGGSPLSFILGIIIGLVGIVGCSINYPIYKRLKNKGMQKYANDIIVLAKEITEQE